MARRRPDTTPATETLEEIDSLFDRAATWIVSHPVPFFAGVGAVLAVAGGIGISVNHSRGLARDASQAVAAVQRAYFNAMGAPAGSTQIVEPANPETAKQVREQYINQFLEVAAEHQGRVAATDALLEAGALQQEIGEPKAAIATWQRAVESTTKGSVLRGVALMRLAGGLEAAGRYADAAKAYEEAGAIEKLPVRFLAMAGAARNYAAAGDRDRAVALFDRVEADAPDLQLPEHVRAQLSELRIAGP